MNRTRIAVLAAMVAALAGAGATLPATASTAASGASNAAPVDRGYRPLHPDYPQVKAQADAMAQAKAGVSGTKPGHGGGGGTSPSIINPDLGWAGVNQTNVTPPDSTGAAGPGHYMELVNDQYGIYSTTTPPGAVEGTGSLSSMLFLQTGVSNSVLSDPQILWDPETSRFYYVAIDTTSGNYALLYGFSKTPDPTGGFCSYRAISYGSTLPDYPKLGDMAGYLLVGVNDFLNGSSYTGSEVAYIAKPTAGSSCPTSAGTTGRISLSEPATPVPAVQTGTAGTGYVVQAADVSGSATTAGNALYVTSIDPTHLTATTAPATTVGDFYMPPSAPQYGTSRKLDTMDGRLERAVEASGVIYTAHAVSTSAGGPSVERWYGITAASPAALAYYGELSDPSLYVFNGAISPDLSTNTNANLVMGVSTSGSNAYPAIQAVKWAVGSATPALIGATSSSAPGTGTVIEQSQTYDSDFSCTGGNSVCRWGDYSGASPSYDTGVSGVFLSNEFSNGGGSIFQAGWSTQNVLITTP